MVRIPSWPEDSTTNEHQWKRIQPESVRVDSRQFVVPTVPIRGLGDDFGANTVSSKNLQKERMRDPAIN
jgi:hypothetical protein